MTEDIITMTTITIPEQKIVPPTITPTKDRYDLLIAQANRRDVCWHCGGRLIWNGDSETEFGTLLSSLSCEQCGAEVSYAISGEKQ